MDSEARARTLNNNQCPGGVEKRDCGGDHRPNGKTEDRILRRNGEDVEAERAPSAGGEGGAARADPHVPVGAEQDDERGGRGGVRGDRDGAEESREEDDGAEIQPAGAAVCLRGRAAAAAEARRGDGGGGEAAAEEHGGDGRPGGVRDGVDRAVLGDAGGGDGDAEGGGGGEAVHGDAGRLRRLPEEESQGDSQAAFRPLEQFSMHTSLSSNQKP